MIKRNIKRKLTALLIVLVMLFSIISLCSCSDFNDLPLDYTLSEGDYVKFEEELAEARRLALGGCGMLRFSFAMKDLSETVYNIQHQRAVAEIMFYSNTLDTEAQARYAEADNMYIRVGEKMNDFYRDIYYSDVPVRKFLFQDMSQGEINLILKTNEQTAACKSEANAIIRSFNSLTYPIGSAEWVSASNDMYSSLVSANRRMAKLYGYNNYYDFAAECLYRRSYSKDERTALRTYVSTKILPLYTDVNRRIDALELLLTEEESATLASMTSDIARGDNPYICGYINSYGKKSDMVEIMNSMFGGNRSIYATSENAFPSAYTSYDEMYATPYVFFGRGAQDIFTVSHEMGHYIAFTNFSSGELPIDTAEIHSQSNTLLMCANMKHQLSENTYKYLALTQLKSSLNAIIISTITDEFEERIYSSERELTPDEYSTVMDEILSAYPGILDAGIYKNNPLDLTKVHSITAGVYYINYATSGIVSLELFALAESNYSAAIEKYEFLCLEATPGYTFMQTIAEAGLASPFTEDSYNNITALVNSLIQ